MGKKTKKLVVIDSHALLHRAWHAVPPLSTKEGIMVNAVFGYTSLLLNIIKNVQPDYIVASFDVAGGTFRHEQYEEYKATRVKQSDEFYDQIPLAYEILEAFNIPILTKKGFEADDIIGTVAATTYKKHENVETIIVTGDLDTLQLVNDRTKVMTLKKGFNDTITYDESAVVERYGLNPDQLIDMKAIMGDSSDNIKGVAGIGLKGATDLIKEFGSLENVYKNLDKISKDRTKKLLSEQKKEAFESKNLVTIVQDVSIKWELKQAELADFDPEEVYEIFQRFEFQSLLNRIPHKEANQNTEQTFAKKGFDYKLINSKADFAKFLEELKQQEIISIDTETSGLDVLTEEILGISFSWKKQHGYYINLSNKDLKQEALDKLKPILEDSSIKKIGHNLKFDYKVFKVLDIELQGIAFDTILAAYLINPSRGLRLEELAFSYLGYKKLKLIDLFDEPPKNKKNLDIRSIPLDKLAWYGVEDVDITLRLYQKLLPLLKDNKSFELLETIEIPLIPALADMELNGISLDTDFLKIMSKEFATNIKKLTTKIYKLAGREFNIASPKQMKEILFEDLEISVTGIKKTKTGLSTAASELEKMKDSHPIIPLIVEYRELAKLQSTYINALPELCNKDTKRVHTSFNQTVTTTGRLSSSDPNLQNIPIRTALGREIRKAFVAPRNHALLSADYSQIELRLAASISKDPKMIASFKNGEDIHTRTAAEIHKIALEDVTKETRRTAKEVNFGVLYGLGSVGLAQRTDMNRVEAKEFITKYFTVYKNIDKYIKTTKSFAHNHGFVQTLFGRRRYLPEINSYMPMLKAQAERMAINMPIQGTAADLMKLAMIKIYQDLPKIDPSTKIVLQVHDELVLEVPKDSLKQVAEFVKTTMENIYKLSVPLTVDIEVGSTWGNLKKL
jgi:DNA polymerase I